MQGLKRGHDLRRGFAEVLGDLALEVPGRPPVEERVIQLRHQMFQRRIQIGL